MHFRVFERDHPLNIAHRGFEKEAPENTLASFLHAMDAGADGIELDIQMTRDGNPVVIHDPTLERTTNGKGKVSSKTLLELRALDAGSWFASEFAGQRIPTLSEVYSVLPRHTVIAVELKPWGVGSEVSQKVIEVVRRFKAEDRTILLSYNPAALWHCARLAPELPTALIHQQDVRELFLQLVRRSFRFTPDVRIFEPPVLVKDPRRVARHNRKGIVVLCGVCNDEQTMRFARDLGVRAIFTSNPSLLKKALA